MQLSYQNFRSPLMVVIVVAFFFFGRWWQGAILSSSSSSSPSVSYPSSSVLWWTSSFLTTNKSDSKNAVDSSSPYSLLGVPLPKSLLHYHKGVPFLVSIAASACSLEVATNTLFSLHRFRISAVLFALDSVVEEFCVTHLFPCVRLTALEDLASEIFRGNTSFPLSTTMFQRMFLHLLLVEQGIGHWEIDGDICFLADPTSPFFDAPEDWVGVGDFNTEKAEAEMHMTHPWLHSHPERNYFFFNLMRLRPTEASKRVIRLNIASVLRGGVMQAQPNWFAQVGINWALAKGGLSLERKKPGVLKGIAPKLSLSVVMYDEILTWSPRYFNHYYGRTTLCKKLKHRGGPPSILHAGRVAMGKEMDQFSVWKMKSQQMQALQCWPLSSSPTIQRVVEEAVRAACPPPKKDGVFQRLFCPDEHIPK